MIFAADGDENFNIFRTKTCKVNPEEAPKDVIVQIDIGMFGQKVMEFTANWCVASVSPAERSISCADIRHYMLYDIHQTPAFGLFKQFLWTQKTIPKKYVIEENESNQIDLNQRIEKIEVSCDKMWK